MKRITLSPKNGPALLRKALLLILVLQAAVLFAQQDTVLNRYRRYLFENKSYENIDPLISTLNGQRQWDQVNYDDKEPAKWKVSGHLSRVRSLALAWADPRSTYYHSDKVWNTLSPALDLWLEKRYKSSNWWHNEIGVPQMMRDILILTGDKMTPDQRKQSLEVLAQHKVKGTGGNLVWSADLGLHYAALMHDNEMLDRCSKALIDEIKITREEGVQPDYSFHQHGARLQMFQYGKAYFAESVRLAWELHGTPWSYPEDKINILVNYALQGWQWMARGRNTVPGTMDRSASREGELQNADMRRLIPYLKMLSPANAVALQQIAERQEGKGYLQGFRYFPYSDFAAYQRKDFSFFLKTISTRTLPTESINNENLKGRLLDNGDAYLIHNGHEYFNLMPVWDWELLPGITNFSGKGKIAREPFSGGVGNDQTGMIAMGYRVEDVPGHKNLSAHKIWVCKDDLVVCLIADLKAHGVEGTLLTALDQCRLQGPVTVNEPGRLIQRGTHSLENVKWIHHADFGYIPIQPSSMQVTVATLSGTWQSINRSHTDAPVTDSVFKPLLVHRLNDSLAPATGYVLVSAKTARRVQQVAQNPAWSVLSNDPKCQAVGFKDGTVAAAFFSAGQIKVEKTALAVDRPCLLLIENGKCRVSDPNHLGGKVTITWKGAKQAVEMPTDGTSLEVPPFDQSK